MPVSAQVLGAETAAPTVLLPILFVNVDQGVGKAKNRIAR
jgi:hypothetical protein